MRRVKHKLRSSRLGRVSTIRLTLVALVGACLAAAGCGGDEEGAPIPADSAAVLQNQLNSVEGRIANGSLGACEDVTDSDDPDTEPVQQAIDGLPDDVDQDVRDALQQGFDRLFELVQERCAELRDQAETDTNTTPVEPAPETETETQTDTTDTTDTFPTDTDTTPTDTTQEPTTPTVPQDPSGGEQNPGNQGGGILAPGDDG